MYICVLVEGVLGGPRCALLQEDWFLTVLPALSAALPCRAVLHWLQISHPFTAQHHHSRAGRWSWEAGSRGGGRRGPVFGDTPCGPSDVGVLGRAALAAGGGFTGVKRAQSLGFVGLTLPVQQFVQNLRRKDTTYELCGEKSKLTSHTCISIHLKSTWSSGSSWFQPRW